ncbi:MAG TPA: HAD hydrolase-like protein [Candidatus Bathyarchaeia archaeon]|nr:HAD hydrolase-like protein [Candidatus Bathyarchaeia archaeon]
MIEAVVFDLDGTLVRLPIDYDRLFAEFSQIMRVSNVRPLVDTVSRVDGKTRALVFAAWEKAELAVEKDISANEEGMKIYKTHADNRKALVTLQGKAIVEAILRQFDLSFDVVVTREDAFVRVDQLEKAIGKLNVNIRNVLFVGNTDGDSAAAEKLGCHFLKIS